MIVGELLEAGVELAVEAVAGLASRAIGGGSTGDDGTDE